MAWDAPPLNLVASGQAAANRVSGLFDDFQSGMQAGDEQRVRGARRSLADLGAGPDGKFDINAAAQKLFAAGDIQGARTLADLGMSEEDRAFRRMQYEQGQQTAADNRTYQRTRDVVQDQQADRRFSLDERNSASRNQDVRTVTNPDGSTSLVRVDMSTGAAQPIQTGAGSTGNVGVNPYATGKFNEGQGKAATYADRMAEAEGPIQQFENLNQGAEGWLGGMAQAAARSAPIIGGDTLANQFASKERQQLDQAQRNFINATLRRESGAVISPEEFDNARRQYFPQPGDTAEVIAQKRNNRQTSMQGIMREAGPSYRPPESRGNRSTAANGTPGTPPGPTYTGARPSQMGASPANAAPYSQPLSSQDSPTGKNTDRVGQGAPQQRAAASVQTMAPGTIVVQGGVRYQKQPDGSFVEVP